MSEAAELIESGAVCELCGEVFEGPSVGHRAQCSACDPSSPLRSSRWDGFGAPRRPRWSARDVVRFAVSVVMLSPLWVPGLLMIAAALAVTLAIVRPLMFGSTCCIAATLFLSGRPDWRAPFRK